MSAQGHVEQVIVSDQRLDDISELDAGAWLTARPELLGWSHHIVWLFAPQSESTPWPGDLVGLDAMGTLILATFKALGRGALRCNPFRGFVANQDERLWAIAREPAALQAEWTKRFADEVERRRVLGTTLFDEDSAMPGVLPHRDHRRAWQRWPGLYAEVDAHLFDDSSEWSFGYRAKVERYLRVRDARKNKSVVYAAFVAIATAHPPEELKAGRAGRTEQAADVLSAAGLEDLAALRMMLDGPDPPRLVLRVARARRQGVVVRVVSRAVET